MVYIRPEALMHNETWPIIVPVGVSLGQTIPNHDTVAIVLPATLTGVCLIIVALRLYTRAFLVKFLGLDDILICFALAFTMVEEVFTGISAGHGLGKHIWHISETDLTIAIKALYVVQCTYPIALGFTKLSILSFYLRLSASPTFRILVYGTITWIISQTLAMSISYVFQCHPIKANWDLESLRRGGKECVNKMALSYSGASLNLATDLWIWLLPIRMLLNLKVSFKQKIMVLAVFSTGGIACIASMIRFVFLAELHKSRDPTWDFYRLVIFSDLETNLAIIAASIPAIKPFIVRFFPKFIGTTFTTSRAASTSYGDNSTGFSTTHDPEHSDFVDDKGRKRSAWWLSEGLSKTIDPKNGKQVHPVGFVFDARIRKQSLSRATNRVVAGENGDQRRTSAPATAMLMSSLQTFNPSLECKHLTDWQLQLNDYCQNINYQHELDSRRPSNALARFLREDSITGTGSTSGVTRKGSRATRASRGTKGRTRRRSRRVSQLTVPNGGVGNDVDGMEIDECGSGRSVTDDEEFSSDWEEEEGHVEQLRTLKARSYTVT